MQDHGELTCYGDLGALVAATFGHLQSPALERRETGARLRARAIDCKLHFADYPSRQLDGGVDRATLAVPTMKGSANAGFRRDVTIGKRQTP